MKKIILLLSLVFGFTISQAQLTFSPQGFYNTPNSIGKWSVGGEIGFPISGKLYAQLGGEYSFKVEDSLISKYVSSNYYNNKYIAFYGGLRYYMGRGAHYGNGLYFAFSPGLSIVNRNDSSIYYNDLTGETYIETLHSEPDQMIFYMNYELGWDIPLAYGIYFTPKIRFRRSGKANIIKDFWNDPYRTEVRSERYFNHWGFGLALNFDLTGGSLFGKARYEVPHSSGKYYGNYNPWRRR